jgi:uncharacterized protein
MTAPLSETGTIGPDAVLLSAPIIGFLFGWFLERAGLARASKLAGQFYFADLTVFKVLFSALLTAALGAFWLDALGLLDLDLVYVPETFVAPQIAGGILFGAGFLVAGLCPGTSCVAAATGRIDGIAAMIGILLGIVTFNGIFDSIAVFYASTALGRVTLPDMFGISHGAMIAILTAVALTGFAAAGALRSSQS